MKNATRIAGCILASFALLACNGDDGGPGGGAPPLELLGTWDANSAVFTDLANTNNTFDVIGAGGSISVTLDSNSRYSLTFTVPPLISDTDVGGYSVSGSTITATSDADPNSPASIDYTLQGNALTLVSDEFEFDFGAGDVPANLLAAFDRR